MKIAIIVSIVAIYLAVSVTAVFAAADLMLDDSDNPSPTSARPQFEVISLNLNDEPKLGDRVPLTVTVRNTGDQSGDYVIELHVSWLSSTITNRIRNLGSQTTQDSVFNVLGPNRPGIYTAQAGDLILPFEIIE
jgi:hypothetical protein